MLILNSKQVIPCDIQLKQRESYLPGFTYLNQSFIKQESYAQNQKEKAMKRIRDFLDQDHCCILLESDDNLSLWCAAPAEATIVKSTNNLKEETNEPALSEEFINYCQQVLAHYIGPMAKWVNEEALESLSSPITRERYIQALAAEIPDAEQTKEFIEKVTSS